MGPRPQTPLRYVQFTMVWAVPPHFPRSRPDSVLLALLALLALATLFGCTRVQQARCDDPTKNKDLSRCVIEDVEIVGNRSISSDELKERIATAESSHVLGGALEHTPLLGPL